MAKKRYATYLSQYHQILLEGKMKETGKSASLIIREAVDKSFYSPDDPSEKSD